MSKDTVDLYISEYDRLHDEIGKTMANRLQIIGIGLATVGVLLGFSLKAMEPNGSRLLAFVGLSFMVPATCFMTLFLWLSEVRRGRCASWYLWRVERVVNAEMKKRVLCWEEDIRLAKEKKEKRLQLFRGHYWTTAAFFWIISLAAAGFGTAYWGWPHCLVALYVAALAVGMGWIFASQLTFFPEYDKASDEWPKPVGDSATRLTGAVREGEPL